MKTQTFLRGGAVFTAVLAAVSFASTVCFAEESSVDDIAAETVNADEEEEIKTYVCGEYTYSILMSETDSDKKAACIEDYSGTEEKVVIPSELDGMKVVALGDGAFSSAVMVTEFTIPATVTQIGTYTFAACVRLMDYVVEEGNPYFEAKDGVLYADEGTSLMRYPIGRLPEKIEIPDGVMRIGHSAFADCASLKTVTFPESVEYIGLAAFAECRALTEVVIPDAVTEITDFCFNDCVSLESVTFPANLTAIGAASFAATELKSVTLPEKLTTIGEQAFIATPMRELTVPKSVTDIGYSAIGWDVSADGTLYSIDEFVLRGYEGSGAETYAEDADYENTFKFVTLETEVMPMVDNNRDTGDSGNTGSNTLKIIGISACGAAILCILGVAVFTGKKKKPQDDESDNDDGNDNETVTPDDVESGDEDDTNGNSEDTEEEQDDEV